MKKFFLVWLVLAGTTFGTIGAVVLGVYINSHYGAFWCLTYAILGVTAFMSSAVVWA